jgi:hypothetical protein
VSVQCGLDKSSRLRVVQGTVLLLGTLFRRMGSFLSSACSLHVGCSGGWGSSYASADGKAMATGLAA